MAESTVDESIRSEGVRHIRVEEEPLLGLAFLLPEDGYSCDIVRGVPSGLVEFLTPLSPLCRLTPNPSAAGYWTIFFHDPMRSPSAMSGRSFVTAFNNTNNNNGSVVTSPTSPNGVNNSVNNMMITANGGSHLNMNGGGGRYSMQSFGARAPEPEVQTINLQKTTSGLGLSIVAARVSSIF